MGERMNEILTLIDASVEQVAALMSS